MIRVSPTFLDPIWVPKWMYEFIPAASGLSGILAVYSPYADGTIVLVSVLLMLYTVWVYAMRLDEHFSYVFRRKPKVTRRWELK